MTGVALLLLAVALVAGLDHLARALAAALAIGIGLGFGSGFGL